MKDSIELVRKAKELLNGTISNLKAKVVIELDKAVENNDSDRITEISLSLPEGIDFNIIIGHAALIIRKNKLRSEYLARVEVEKLVATLPEETPLTIDTAVSRMVTYLNESFYVGKGIDYDRFVIKKNKKYIKVIRSKSSKPTGSVYAFINIETGQIFKPASWAAPAKHARGTVYDMESVKRCCGEHSVVYLR